MCVVFRSLKLISECMQQHSSMAGKRGWLAWRLEAKQCHDLSDAINFQTKVMPRLCQLSGAPA